MAVGTDPAKLVITDSNIALKKINSRCAADDESQSADVASSLCNTI